MFCMYDLIYCASAGRSIAGLALLMAIMLILIVIIFVKRGAG